MTYRPKPITGRTGPQPGYATEELRAALYRFVNEQRRLGAEFEAVLDANLKELYEP